MREGADGRARCWWCGDDPVYVDYHDHEWGRPLHDERQLYGLPPMWSARWPGRMVEMGMGASRMGPATDRAYVAIAEAKLTHDGDRRLARPTNRMKLLVKPGQAPVVGLLKGG